MLTRTKKGSTRATSNTNIDKDISKKKKNKKKTVTENPENDSDKKSSSNRSSKNENKEDENKKNEDLVLHENRPLYLEMNCMFSISFCDVF